MMPTRFLRATACVVLFTFSAWVAAPAVAAVNMGREREAWLEANRGAPLQARSDLSALTSELGEGASVDRPATAMKQALAVGGNLAARAQRVLAAGQQV